MWGPSDCSFPFASNEAKGLEIEADLDKTLDSRLSRYAAATPTAESRNRVSGGKKADCCRNCVMWFKGGRGWSWTWRWRARRGGRLRCSRGCKRAEKCSSRQRAPPRPRPAPRFLFFHNILKKKFRSKPRSGIRCGLQYLNCWSYKFYKKIGCISAPPFDRALFLGLSTILLSFMFWKWEPNLQCVCKIEFNINKYVWLHVYSIKQNLLSRYINTALNILVK